MDRQAQLCDWRVVVLRPAATRGPLLRALRAAGARPVPLSSLRLLPAADASEASRQLQRALACDRVLFTSPAAVRFAARLEGWAAPAPGRAVALGAGTARALARAGAPGACFPQQHSDSEGVLALSAFDGVDGCDVGVVTAPGGRGVLVPALEARGARVVRADVYRRLPPRFDARHRHRLATALAAAEPLALLASSGEALQALVAGLPGAEALLARAVVVVPGARLAALARQLGATTVLQAAGPGPQALVEALAAHAGVHAFR